MKKSYYIPKKTKKKEKPKKRKTVPLFPWDDSFERVNKPCALSKREYDRFVDQGLEPETDFTISPGLYVEILRDTGIDLAKQLVDIMNAEDVSIDLRQIAAQFFYMFTLILSVTSDPILSKKVDVKDDKDLHKLIYGQIRRDFYGHKNFAQFKEMYSLAIAEIIQHKKEEIIEEKRRVENLKKIPRRQRVISLKNFRS